MANTDHEYANFSKAARIILELNTKVLREYLTTVTPPATLPQTIVNLKVLNQSQKTIVQNIFNIFSYDECDSSLLYILIRNYCNITPSNGWSKPVNPGDTGVGDDVERMRVLRNELYGHATTARLSNGDYSSFIQDVRGIMVRFDSCHGGTYQRCLSTGIFENELNDIILSPMDPSLQKYYNALFGQLSNVKSDLITLNNKIDAVDNKTDKSIDTLSKDLKKVDDKIDTKIGIVEQDLKMVDDKFDMKVNTVEQNLLGHEEMFEAVENTLGTQEERLDSLVKDMETLKKVIPTNCTSDTALIPHEHDLEYVYRMNWVCKKCGVCSKNEKSFYCVLCDYDECIVCAGKEEEYFTRYTKGKTILEDDDSPHKHFVNGTWRITSHHSKDDGPINVLRSFDREKFISKGEKNQKLYESGFINYYSEEEFDKELEKKFVSTFGPEFENQPWLMNNLRTDFDDDRQTFNDICAILRAWSISTPYSFLVINYSLEDHARKLGMNLNKLKKELKIYAVEDESERILLYRGDIDTLFVIRCTDSSSRDDICNEVIKGQNDCKLFSILHMNTLTNSNVSIVSMVVTSNLKDVDLTGLNTCRECIKEGLIVSKDTLPNYLEYIEGKMIRSEIDKQDNDVIRKKTLFLSFSSRITGFVSITDVHMPNISVDGAQLLTRIYLNKSQRDFLHSKRKHSILQGGFGSGKTILAQLRLKQIVQTADSDDSIYLILHSNETLLRNLIKLMVDGIPNKKLKNDHIFVMNANEYCQKFGLIAPLLVSDILQDITERHEYLPGRPHLIIDELEGSNISDNEGKTIRECLEKLLDSYILLVTHSLEVFRKKVTTKFYVLSEKEYYNGFHYGATGMRIFVLDQIMRNTTGINALAQNTIQTLKGSVTVFHERQIDLSILTTTNGAGEVNETKNKEENRTIDAGTCEKRFPISSTALYRYGDTSSKNDGSVNNTRKTDIIWKHVGKSHSFSASSDHEKDIAIANINLQGEELSLITSPIAAKSEYHRANADIQEDVAVDKIESTARTLTQNIRMKTVREVNANTDHVLKQINNIPGKKSSNRIISKFNFPGAWENGHGVKGKIPMLHYPFEKEYLNYNNINDPQTRGRLCYVLRNMNTPNSPIIGMGIICFEIIDSLLFYEVLKALGCPVTLYTPAMDADTTPMDIPRIRYILETHVIITDHIGSRGLEFQKLILCVNPNETFLHQYLLEGMTRCVYELHVIVINKELKGNQKNITCGKIIKNWIKAGLVKKQVITVCTENHNADGDDDVKSLKTLCKTIDERHYIHLSENDLKVSLVPIKKVTVDVSRCFDIYYTELSNTQHIDDHVIRPLRRKRNEQNIKQECKKKGFSSYLDVILRNKTDMISYLMSKNYDAVVKFRDFKDRSLLHIAIDVGADDSAVSFIENGMPLDISSQHIKNWRNHAQNLGKTKVVETIDHAMWKRQYEATSNKYNHVVNIIRSKRNEELRHILRCFPKVIELKDRFDTPILHVAAWTNNMIAMEMLISHGVDVYEVGDSRYNILHNIAWYGDDNSLECLFYIATEYKELVRGKTKYGLTPIDYAKERKKHNMVKILENLSSK